MDEVAKQTEIRGKRKTKRVNQEVAGRKNCELPRDTQTACQRKGGTLRLMLRLQSYARAIKSLCLGVS